MVTTHLIKLSPERGKFQFHTLILNCKNAQFSIYTPIGVNVSLVIINLSYKIRYARLVHRLLLGSPRSLAHTLLYTRMACSCILSVNTWRIIANRPLLFAEFNVYLCVIYSGDKRLLCLCLCMCGICWEAAHRELNNCHIGEKLTINSEKCSFAFHIAWATMKNCLLHVYKSLV